MCPALSLQPAVPGVSAKYIWYEMGMPLVKWTGYYMSAVEPICRSAVATQSLAQTSTACIRYSGGAPGYFITRQGKKLPARDVSWPRTSTWQGGCLVCLVAEYRIQ